MSDRVRVSLDMAAPAGVVWAMVADVTRMGEWSPENVGAVWLRGATGPERGATFRGTNRNGGKKWHTVATILESEPGRLLTFRVKAGGMAVAEWQYSFEDTPTGCRVTETWIDRRGWIVRAMGKPVSGVADRAGHNRAGMEQTLSRLKDAAESASATEAR